MKKRIFFLLSILAVLAVNFSAFAASGKSYEYTILPDGTAEITRYTGQERELSIPPEIDGFRVTSIGEYAFLNQNTLFSVTVPDSVTNIGYAAFAECLSLTSVSIPDSVAAIGKDAFFGCDQLILVAEGPYAVAYAVENGLSYIEPLEPVSKEEYILAKINYAWSVLSQMIFKTPVSEQTGTDTMFADIQGAMSDNTALPVADTPAPYAADTPIQTAVNTQVPASNRPDIEAAVGQIIEFGSWEQDNDTENGPEPIEWQVLRIEDDFALVISVKGLEARPWNAEKSSAGWENSTLRDWLNGEFYEKAFGTTGPDYVGQSFNSNPGNPATGNAAGRNTKDSIFLLSLDEAVTWMPSNAERTRALGIYAEMQGAIGSGGNGMWWLRTGGRDAGTAAYVDVDGSINESGFDADADYIMVCPAFWFKLKGTRTGLVPPTPQPTATPTNTPAAAQTEAYFRLTSEVLQTSYAQTREVFYSTQTKMAEPTSTPSPAPSNTPVPTSLPSPTAITAAKGGFIVFGHYEQDNDLSNGPEPIIWQVLEVENDRALVISKYGLDTKPYNEVDAHVTWETCTLRKWLNGDFYNSAFSSQEKTLIEEVTIPNKNNERFGTGGGNPTSDRIFLPDIDEAYLKVSFDDRPCEITAYAKANGAFAYEGFSWWWLRSPGIDGNLAARVNVDGSVFDTGSGVDSNDVVVRPAFWLDLSTVPAAENIPEPEHTNTASDLSALQTGDIIAFGSLEQDNDLSNGDEPIEWQVLTVDNGRALLISRYILDSKLYNEDRTDVTWETGTLRRWLNRDFYNSAFTGEEKNRIQESVILNPDNASFGTAGGNTTTDRIFLLSIDEVKQYFPDDESRKCLATARARDNGAWTDSVYRTSWWWLRSPGITGDASSIVETYGALYESGIFVDNAGGGVRPAFWLDLSDDPEKSNTSQPASSDLHIPADLHAGDFISFGQYEQDNNKKKGPEPIEWQVLAVENGKALLISTHVLDAKQYHTSLTDVTWESSTLRTWLNGEFYNNTFSDAEKNRIWEVTNQNPDNPEWGTAGGNTTRDRIFLLSIDEAYRYLTNEEDRISYATKYARANGANIFDTDKKTWWWLRSPGLTEEMASLVDAYGDIWDRGDYIYFTDGGVRPSFWLEF